MTDDDRRLPGRPPLDDRERGHPISFRMRDAEYAKVCADASRDRVSVSEWIRQTIARGGTVPRV